MEVIETLIKDLIVLQPRVFCDDRGYFFESFNASKLPEHLQQLDWVQDNESMSTRGVLRGLHYQVGEHAQAKLVRAISGEIYDVAVDIRPDSATCGQWHGEVLTEENKRQMLVPRGFAHGFLVLSETAIFAYKCDNYYSKESECGIIYNDQSLDIDWPEVEGGMLLSDKDMKQPRLGEHLAF